MGTEVMLPLPKADPHRVFCGRINFPLPVSLVVSQIIAFFLVVNLSWLGFSRAWGPQCWFSRTKALKVFPFLSSCAGYDSLCLPARPSSAAQLNKKRPLRRAGSWEAAPAASSLFSGVPDGSHSSGWQLLPWEHEIFPTNVSFPQPFYLCRRAGGGHS